MLLACAELVQIANEKGWGESPYAILACVPEFGLASHKVRDINPTQKVCLTLAFLLVVQIWFYDTITLPGDDGPLKESRAALWFTLIAPEIPELWADLCKPHMYVLIISAC